MRRIAENVYVGAQITPEELPALRTAGILHIICHRPDGESPDQPAFAAIAQAAAVQGIATSHIPVAGGFPPEAVGATARALEGGLPTLMFCRSGIRSTALWALAEARKGRAADDLVREAAALGYDLTPLLGALREKA